MAGRRTITNEQTTEWIENALTLVERVNPPAWALPEVFNAMLNAVQVPDTTYSDEEAIEAAKQALTIVATCAPPETLEVKAFWFAFTCTSQREQVLILKDVPGLGTALPKH